MTGSMSRRSFLKRAPVAAVAVGTPVTVAVAEVRAEPVEDTDMKCMRLARELHNAMKAHYGKGCTMVRNEVDGSLFFSPPPAPPRIVEFTGAGWYEVEENGPDRVEVMWLENSRFPPHPKNGRIVHAVPKDTLLQPRYYEESWLRKIIVRKVGLA